MSAIKSLSGKVSLRQDLPFTSEMQTFAALSGRSQTQDPKVINLQCLVYSNYSLSINRQQANTES